MKKDKNRGSESLGRCHGYFKPLWPALSILICMLEISVCFAAARTNTRVIKLNISRRKWYLVALRVAYDYKNRIYEADGKVRIWSDDRILECHTARLDLANQQVDLRGSVYIQYGRNWIKGDRAVWNLDTETGWIDGGTIYLASNGFYVRGKRISKTGPREFRLNEGFATSCNPENPDWAISYREAIIDLYGHGEAKNSCFRIRGIPVLYSPYLVFPVNRQRQSGFLLPTFGVSNLNGTEAELPFYWATREDMDLTYYINYLQKRGWMQGIEYRIAHNSLGEGVWLINYLHDQASEGYLETRGYSFQQKDRFWIRAIHNFLLPHAIEGYLTLDVVSDPNYLKEFTSGSTSLNYTNRAFARFTDRELINDESIPTRENSLYLVHRRENSLGDFNLHYWYQADSSLQDTTLQQLPRLDFDLAPTWLASLPLYYSLETSLIDYWRDKGDRGVRLDLYPRVYYPIHLDRYLDLEPSAGIRATGYNVDWYRDDKSSFRNRLLPDIRLNLSGRLNRVYNLRIWSIVAVQHAFRPELEYVYIPKINQEDLPEFDEIDRIRNQNAIRYGFSTFLIAKEASDTHNVIYRELARLSVFQRYQIEETTPQGDGYEAYPTDHRLSDVDIELDITPGRYLDLSYDLSISPYKATANSQDLTFSLKSTKGHRLSLTYRSYRDTEVDEVESRLVLNLRSNITFETYHDYSFDKEKFFQHYYQLTVKRGCWSIQLAYREEGEDRRFGFMINLLGIGHVGQS